MPNHKKPIDFLVHHGNAKLTKAEIEKRRKSEVVAKTDHIVPSSFLDSKLHDKFYWYVDQLSEFDLMSNLDSDSLSRYVELQDSYELLTKQINKLDIIKNIDLYKQLEVIQNKRLKELRMLGNDLGLTMVGRAKLSKPVKDNEEETPEQRLFGGNL